MRILHSWRISLSFALLEKIGKLTISRNRLELAQIFDEAVLKDRELMVNGRPQTAVGLNKLIYRARDQLIHRGDTATPEGSTAADVDLILLSGGLGSSEYIKYKIEEFLANNPGTGSGAFVPRVHTLSRPQMCVCQGLIENRVLSIWRAGKCNGSYGVLQRKVYKSWKWTHQLAKHGNHLHNTEGRRYVEQVIWLIKKAGEVHNLLCCSYFAHIKQNQPKPIDPPSFRYTFEPGSPNLMIEFVVSNEARPSRFPSRGMTTTSAPRRHPLKLMLFYFLEDFVAKVTCDLGEPARDPETWKPYCFVELSFHVARVEVKCCEYSRIPKYFFQVAAKQIPPWQGLPTIERTVSFLANIRGTGKLGNHRNTGLT